MHEERERGRVRRALVRYMEKKGWPRVMLSLIIIGFCLDFMTPGADTIGQAVKELLHGGGAQ